MKSVKKASKELIWADGVALVGGFIAFVYLFLSMCMNSVNDRLMMKQILQDSYAVKKNKDYLEVGKEKPCASCCKPTPKRVQKEKKAKKKAAAKKEVVDEEAGSEGGGEEGGQIEMGQFEGGLSQKSGKSGPPKEFDEIRSNKSAGAKSQKSAGGASQKSKASQRSANYLELKAQQDAVIKAKAKRQTKVEFLMEKLPEHGPIEIPYLQMLRLDWTPFFCRTKYQKALNTLLKKAQNKLHR